MLNNGVKQERPTWIVIRRLRQAEETGFLVQRRVRSAHVLRSTYDTPEEALDAAISLMTHGAMGVYIVDPSHHVFTPHRFANRIASEGLGGRGARHLKHPIHQMQANKTQGALAVYLCPSLARASRQEGPKNSSRKKPRTHCSSRPEGAKGSLLVAYASAPDAEQSISTSVVLTMVGVVGGADA